MAGPIDTRIQPTKVNEFAKSKPLKWFEENLINYVPFQCKGAFRQVYPGFIQLTAFVSMNLERHIKRTWISPIIWPRAKWKRPRPSRRSMTNISR